MRGRRGRWEMEEQQEKGDAHEKMEERARRGEEEGEKEKVED